MEVTAFLPSVATPFGVILICPRCHEEHVHPLRTIASDGEDGSLRYIDLVFSCEQGHTWTLTITADHGLAYVEISAEEGQR